ncbi:MAG: DUF4112 domain-containing protein [Sandaracinaceae bacterium]
MTLERDHALKGHSNKLAGAAADRLVDRLGGDKLAGNAELKRAVAASVAPWAERLVRWLDDFIKIPGTNVGIGLDPIVGFLLPGAGDAITGTGSIALLFLALKERVPTVVLLRMCMNILVDTVGGLLPLIGDAFDVVWRSNRRNLDLIQRHKTDPSRKASFADYLVVAVGVTLAIASIVIPIVIVYGLGLSAFLGIRSLFE